MPSWSARSCCPDGWWGAWRPCVASSVNGPLYFWSRSCITFKRDLYPGFYTSPFLSGWNIFDSLSKKFIHMDDASVSDEVMEISIEKTLLFSIVNWSPNSFSRFKTRSISLQIRLESSLRRSDFIFLRSELYQTPSYDDCIILWRHECLD